MSIVPPRVNSIANIWHKGNFWHIDIFDLLLGKGERAVRKVPLRDLAVFCRKAAFLLGSGLPIKEAVPVLADQQQSRLIGGVISDIHSLVMQGESFSHALKATGAFPVFMCGYIAIGERTASLSAVCLSLADYFEARVKTQEELKAAMIYPMMVSVIMLGVIVLAVTLVLPGYSRIFETSGVSLPAATNALLAASAFLSSNIFLVVLCSSVLIFFAIGFLKSVKGRKFSAFAKLKIPILKQNANRNIVQGLSLLLSSGLSISEAIPMCGEVVDNPVIRRDLEKLSATVSSGVAFGVALSEISYINPLIIGLARVGEKTGNLAQSMEKCNAYLEEVCRSEISRLNKLVTPIITLVLGVILGAIMLAIVLPTFELATTI